MFRALQEKGVHRIFDKVLGGKNYYCKSKVSSLHWLILWIIVFAIEINLYVSQIMQINFVLE